MLTARVEINDLPDGSLLQRFAGEGEQAAFTALFQRHASFVLRVCQRVLGDSHTAQDAFQLTFLVLAQQARVLHGQGSLTGWLYKVAYRLAVRLREMAGRRRRREEQAADSATARWRLDADPCLEDIEEQELRQALREELEHLPEKYRTPLVLCYLDGQTHAEAARAIGLPRGSMAKRIGEALTRLRERLLDRGFLP